jgi:hypothetical protein
MIGMAWQVKDQSTELTKLKREVGIIRDALFISGFGANALGSRNPGGASGGQNPVGGGGFSGMIASQPTLHTLTDVDVDGTPTGTFDKLQLRTSSVIVDAAGALDLRFIQGTLNDGTILYLKPKNGKTLTLKTGGNIDIVSDVTVNDNQCAILKFYADDTTPDANGNYVVATVSSAGGSGGYNLIQDEGISLPAQTTIDFVGAGVTATNGAGKTIVTIPGTAGGMATDMNNMVFPTIPTVDMSMNGFGIVNCKYLRTVAGTTEVGEESGVGNGPFDNVWALRYQPQSSTPLSGTRGLAKTGDEVYINVDNAAGEFAIRSSGVREIIFRVFTFTSFASSMIFDTASSQILFGLSGVRGQIGFDGSNVVIDRLGGGANGIILRNNLTDIVEVFPDEVTFRKNIEMNANRIFDCAELGSSFGGMIIAQTGGVQYMGMSGLGQIQHLTQSDNEIFLNSSGNMLFHVGTGDNFILQIGASQHHLFSSTEYSTDTDIKLVNASGARIDFDSAGVSGSSGASQGFIIVKVGGVNRKIEYFAT